MWPKQTFFKIIFLLILIDVVLCLKKLDCICRVVSNQSVFSKIIGGEIAHHTAFPWIVSITNDGLDRKNLKRKLADKNYKLKNNICGGFIINERWVATAAHCTDRPEKIYSVGFGNYNDLIRIYDAGRVRVSRVINHPDYNKKFAQSSDISLLELEEPIEFNTTVGPACLGLHKYEFLQYPQLLLVAGWGSSNYLKRNRATQEIIYYSQNDTTRYLKYAWMRDNSRYSRTCARDPTKLCIKSHTVGESICTGDSGAPIHYNSQNGRSFVLGPASSVNGLSREEDPEYVYYCQGFGNYQKIASYMPWIQKYVGQNYCSDENY